MERASRGRTEINKVKENEIESGERQTGSDKRTYSIYIYICIYILLGAEKFAIRVGIASAQFRAASLKKIRGETFRFPALLMHFAMLTDVYINRLAGNTS